MIEYITYLGLGALGGLWPVADWVFFGSKDEKEKLNKLKVIRSICLGAIIGGVIGVAYGSYFLAFTNGIAGESIGRLVLKLTQVGESVLKVLGKKK